MRGYRLDMGRKAMTLCEIRVIIFLDGGFGAYKTTLCLHISGFIRLRVYGLKRGGSAQEVSAC